MSDPAPDELRDATLETFRAFAQCRRLLREGDLDEDERVYRERKRQANPV